MIGKVNFSKQKSKMENCKLRLYLSPLYWFFEKLPATRDTARRLGLVTLEQMVNALLAAIEHPAEEIRILDVPKIRRLPDA